MSTIKKLAGQTAIYGASSIVGRFLNYLLTPLYTAKAVFSLDQYGIITEMYAYVAFLVVFLTYGMETSYFRFSTLKEESSSKKVYSTTLYSLFSTTTLFIIFASVFAQPIADWLKYPNHSEYIIWFAIIVGLDAISSIPLAKLRLENKAKKFAVVNLLNVAINIGLNLFFIGYCKLNYVGGADNGWLINTFYNDSIGVGYVFIANLISSVIKFIMLIPDMKFNTGFDKQLFRRMLSYAFPMLFVGLAGIVNETLDRAMLKNMLSNEYLKDGVASNMQQAVEMAQAQLGIYGANYKITIIITMFIQAFRFAAEPFFFSHDKEKGSKAIYSKVMTYFIIVVSFIFLLVTLYLDVFKHFTPNPAYWIGLKVVPILLLANIFLGVYYNQSIWYKLSHKTHYGAIISLVGAVITITLNFIFIPKYGYVASAWATFICYASMMLMSYFWGRKVYPIPYNLKKGGFYFVFALVLFFVKAPLDYTESSPIWVYGYHFVLLSVFLAVVLWLEKPNLKSLNFLKK